MDEPIKEIDGATVGSLIKALQSMPQDALVFSIWDGGARTCLRFAWVSKSVIVCLAWYDEYVYHDNDRPVLAPSMNILREWTTPIDPEEI